MCSLAYSTGAGAVSCASKTLRGRGARIGGHWREPSSRPRRLALEQQIPSVAAADGRYIYAAMLERPGLAEQTVSDDASSERSGGDRGKVLRGEGPGVHGRTLMSCGVRLLSWRSCAAGRRCDASWALAGKSHNGARGTRALPIEILW